MNILEAILKSGGKKFSRATAPEIQMKVIDGHVWLVRHNMNYESRYVYGPVADVLNLTALDYVICDEDTPNEARS